MESIANTKINFHIKEMSRLKGIKNNSSFINLIKGGSHLSSNENLGIHFGPQFSNNDVQGLQASKKNSDSQALRDSTSPKENTTRAVLDAINFKVKNVVSKNDAGVASSELYEQSHFSIGKLSYLNDDGTVNAKDLTVKFNQVSGVGLSLSYAELKSNTAMLVPGVVLPDLLAATQIQGHRQHVKKSEVDLPGVVRAYAVADPERRKLSLLKEDSGSQLVVRDYFSDRSDIFFYLKNFIGLAKLKITRLTVNGEVVK